MKTFLLALTGVALGLAAAPTYSKEPVTGFTCTKWKDGVCVATHRVRGAPAPYATGYVFGPNYTYTAVSDIPQPVVGYYHLDPNGRYVFSNGYVYVVDPTTYAVTKVIDVESH
jgi:hypothetical protein